MDLKLPREVEDYRCFDIPHVTIRQGFLENVKAVV